MEDGLGLSLSIEALEKSPPPVASSPLKTTNSERLGVNNNSFLDKLDYFLKSPKQVTGSKTSQQAPYTKLNLGWFGGSSKPRQEAVGVRGTIKVSPPSDLSCSTAGKRSAAEISSTVDGGGEKKKLRLSKEQSTLLEQTFLDHSTLNNKQKLYLAKQLNLKPRQVEVWFQNRRARTKLKQTEVDCEFLRKYCEKLCDENKRLQRELHELRSPNNHRVLCHACKRSSTTTDGSGPHGAVAAFSRPVKPNVSGLFSNKSTLLKL